MLRRLFLPQEFSRPLSSRLKMKNLFDSRYSFWKKSVVQPRIPDNAGSKALSSLRYPSFPTKIIKDFVDGISKKTDPVVLDIGAVTGSNIEYFLNFGIKVYMEDVLAAYAKPQYSVLIDDKLTFDDEKFFAENLRYLDGHFDGLICWDILDYLDAKFARNFVAQISAKMKPGSLVLGFFHTHKVAGSTKYRLINESTLEHVPLERRMEPKKIYPSREINQLFPGYQSQKFYLLKHNLLEVMLRKS
jgi:Methyltransferase domain